MINNALKQKIGDIAGGIGEKLGGIFKRKAKKKAKEEAKEEATEERKETENDTEGKDQSGQ